MTEATKRAYRRLDPKSWAEIEAFWRNGSHTLEEISAEYGVTTRALQSHFQKHDVRKGENAAAIATAAKEAVDASEVGDYAGRLEAFRAARTQTVINVNRLERLLMTQIDIVETTPSEAFRALSPVKNIAAAAQALERLQIVRTTALGIETEQSDVLPVIEIVDLTDNDITRLHRFHEAGIGDENIEDEEANEIICS